MCSLFFVHNCMTIYVQFQNSGNKLWRIKIIVEAAIVGGRRGWQNARSIGKEHREISGVMEMSSSGSDWWFHECMQQPDSTVS